MPDLPTLLALLAIGSAVLGVSTLVVAARTEHFPGLATWGWALLANTATHLAFALRLVGWPALSIIASNLFTALSMVLFITAVLQFHRLRPPAGLRALLWAAVPLGLLSGVLLLHQHHARNLASVLLHAALMLAMAWVAWHRPRGRERVAGHLLIMAGALGMAVVFLWRAGLMLGTTDWPAPLFVPPVVQAVTLVMVFVALLTNTLGFALMQMEYAIQGQHDLATHDPLTGASNRRELLESMARLAGLARRQGQALAVLMVDIDHFKRVNDTHGHVNGDVVLREVARRLQDRLRRSDLLARFGGEEFVVLLPDTRAGEAVQVAESLRTAVSARPILLPDGQGEVRVTVSIGAHARVPGDAPDEADRMIAASDQAMYRAKSLGRDRVEQG